MFSLNPLLSYCRDVLLKLFGMILPWCSFHTIYYTTLYSPLKPHQKQQNIIFFDMIYIWYCSQMYYLCVLHFKLFRLWYVTRIIWILCNIYCRFFYMNHKYLFIISDLTSTALPKMFLIFAGKSVGSKATPDSNHDLWVNYSYLVVFLKENQVLCIHCVFRHCWFKLYYVCT